MQQPSQDSAIPGTGPILQFNTSSNDKTLIWTGQYLTSDMNYPANDHSTLNLTMGISITKQEYEKVTTAHNNNSQEIDMGKTNGSAKRKKNLMLNCTKTSKLKKAKIQAKIDLEQKKKLEMSPDSSQNSIFNKNKEQEQAVNDLLEIDGEEDLMEGYNPFNTLYNVNDAYAKDRNKLTTTQNTADINPNMLSNLHIEKQNIMNKDNSPAKVLQNNTTVTSKKHANAKTGGLNSVNNQSNNDIVSVRRILKIQKQIEYEKDNMHAFRLKTSNTNENNHKSIDKSLHFSKSKKSNKKKGDKIYTSVNQYKQEHLKKKMKENEQKLNEKHLNVASLKKFLLESENSGDQKQQVIGNYILPNIKDLQKLYEYGSLNIDEFGKFQLQNKINQNIFDPSFDSHFRILSNELQSNKNMSHEKLKDIIINHNSNTGQSIVTKKCNLVEHVKMNGLKIRSKKFLDEKRLTNLGPTTTMTTTTPTLSKNRIIRKSSEPKSPRKYRSESMQVRTNQPPTLIDSQVRGSVNQRDMIKNVQKWRVNNRYSSSEQLQGDTVQKKQDNGNQIHGTSLNQDSQYLENPFIRKSDGTYDDKYNQNSQGSYGDSLAMHSRKSSLQTKPVVYKNNHKNIVTEINKSDFGNIKNNLLNELDLKKKVYSHVNIDDFNFSAKNNLGVDSSKAGQQRQSQNEELVMNKFSECSREASVSEWIEEINQLNNNKLKFNILKNKIGNKHGREILNSRDSTTIKATNAYSVNDVVNLDCFDNSKRLGKQKLKGSRSDSTEKKYRLSGLSSRRTHDSINPLGMNKRTDSSIDTKNTMEKIEISRNQVAVIKQLKLAKDCHLSKKTSKIPKTSQIQYNDLNQEDTINSHQGNTSSASGQCLNTPEEGLKELEKPFSSLLKNKPVYKNFIRFFLISDKKLAQAWRVK